MSRYSGNAKKFSSFAFKGSGTNLITHLTQETATLQISSVF
ncbi:hypothetical protein BLL52_4227 [Rhodoferax antarcticus ANT.BR]|uniref:Uncharacterized protein n=1 Tax=Rhodoferax antarcticus ANT.BR TaxID=1111071 RepID=A0A1Q8Y994_9BURK|nr:hypothetical protein BLL52_4227 [Rhodoferax antarcticus ANT.BR]